MSLYEARIQAAQRERRRTARFTIDIPASFRTVSGDRQCRMANISDNGAKLDTDNPPREGITGWLLFGELEIFCKVIWTNDSSCGVEFERAITERTLIDIAGEQAQPRGPVASTGNIQMGRKRGRRLVSSEPQPQARFFSKRQACSSGSV